MHRPARRARHRDRGFALITVVVLSFLLVVLAVSTVRILNGNSRDAIQNSARDQVTDIAEGGLDWAVANFSNDAPNQVAVQDVALGAGTYTIANPVAENNGNTWLIQVTAYVPNRAHPRVAKVLQGTLTKVPNHFGQYAVLSGGTINGNGNHIHTTGNIHADGSVTGTGTYNGNVEAVGSVAAGVAGTGYQALPGSANIPIPTYSRTDLSAILTAATASGGTHAISTLAGTVSGYYRSSAAAYDPIGTPPPAAPVDSPGPGLNLTLGGGVLWIAGNFAGGSISGSGTIVIDGTFSMSGLDAINATPAGLTFIVLSPSATAVSLSGNAGTTYNNASFFVPYGGASYSGNATLNGSIITGAGGAVLSGNGQINFQVVPPSPYIATAWGLQGWNDVTSRVLGNTLRQGGI